MNLFPNNEMVYGKTKQLDITRMTTSISSEEQNFLNKSMDIGQGVLNHKTFLENFIFFYIYVLYNVMTDIK